MFLTGKVNGVFKKSPGFATLSPNKSAIRKFFTDLSTSKHATGVGANGKRTLTECITKYYAGDTERWIRDRTAAIERRAAQYAEFIKTRCNYDAVRRRLGAVMDTIDLVDGTLPSNAIYNGLSRTDKTIFRRREIAKKFAQEVELSIVAPWATAIDPGSPRALTGDNAFKYQPVVGRRGGRRDTRRRKDRRKTHRRRKLPKLL